MTSPAERMAPERPDLATERTLPEPDVPPFEDSQEPADSTAEERGLEEIVNRDHPLS